MSVPLWKTTCLSETQISMDAQPCKPPSFFKWKELLKEILESVDQHLFISTISSFTSIGKKDTPIFFTIATLLFCAWAPSFSPFSVVPQHINNPPSFLYLHPLSLSQPKGSLKAVAGPQLPSVSTSIHSVSFTHSLVSTCCLPYPRTIKCCCSMGFSMPESSQFTVSYGRARQSPPIGPRPPNLHLKLRCLFWPPDLYMSLQHFSLEVYFVSQAIVSKIEFLFFSICLLNSVFSL